MSKKNSAQKFLSKYLTETAVPALAAASAGTGTAVAIDRALHDDEDHAAFKINIARDFYEGNPRASSAINYIYGPGEFSPMEQSLISKVLNGNTDETAVKILNSARPGIFSRIEEVREKTDLVPTLAAMESLVTAGNVQAIDGNPMTGLEDAYASDGINTYPGMIGSLLAGAGTYALANKSLRSK